MDFLLSPLAGLVTSLILLDGPILPDVSGLFAAAAPPAVAERAAEPVRAPSVDSLLALPDGYRAQGYEKLVFSRAASKPFAGR